MITRISKEDCTDLKKDYPDLKKRLHRFPGISAGNLDLPKF
jgi:hypothetical protein